MKATTFIADLFTIGASGIAIYLFITKRNAISAVFSLLINYTYQLTLSELKEKLELLNEYNANDDTEIEKVISLFHEISGQIKGNDKLKDRFVDITKKIEDLVSNKKRLNDARKRGLIAELRERIRHLNVNSINSYVEGGE